MLGTSLPPEPDTHGRGYVCQKLLAGLPKRKEKGFSLGPLLSLTYPSISPASGLLLPWKSQGLVHTGSHFGDWFSEGTAEIQLNRALVAHACNPSYTGGRDQED
jgi:hypothetical protein